MSTISILGPTRENLSEKDASFNQNVDRKYEDSIDYDFSAAVTSKLQRNQSGRCDISERNNSKRVKSTGNYWNWWEANSLIVTLMGVWRSFQNQTNMILRGYVALDKFLIDSNLYSLLSVKWITIQGSAGRNKRKIFTLKPDKSVGELANWN